MGEIPWFEYDEDDLNVAQRAFIDVLAERASDWLVDPADAVVVPPAEPSCLNVIVWLDIVDPTRNQGILTVGAHFNGTAVHADKLHNQLFSLPDEATELNFTAIGNPAELAEQTAAWFEAILARPLIRCEWQHRGKTYAVRYEFADTGGGLIEGFDDKLAPRELRKRLAAEASVRGRRRINRAGLGEPDLITRVRGGRLEDQVQRNP
ncbi:hypothetical protein DFJ67_4092 [Asanoa ferruginea]|uniref:Uncharacterized protein n=1 Tax=Asanoa ferruginea TaxID=53367 RepID=A0A3D9ZNK9_9ACTN|nr:hypothetical protein [Asanoa ferruginea]REF98082.1 hypothetical protein DFJ67_4092 [Asanoa ferruginea]GIF49624.1 hypothetical protein Afe04nite_41630 [Asanoa ferruginea]